MKAAIRTQYGPPDVLTIREIEKPEPKDNEVLVKVHATTVNRTDCAILMAQPFIMRFITGLFKPKSPITGTDFAGEIEDVGKNVTLFKAGDKVWGFHDDGLGTHAQYFTIAEDMALITMPEKLSYEDAAASSEGAHYAYNFINKVKLKSGIKVLVNGATGAIGSAMVQMLNHYGANVTAVGNTQNIELLKSLGAGKTIDYTKADFTKDDEKYDFVFDAVGKSTFGKCRRLLKSGGVYISSELGPWIQNPFLALITPLSGGKQVKFPLPTDIKRSLQFIKELIEKEEFKPVIDRKYPLEKIREAFEYVASGQKTGNVVIIMT